MLDRIKNSRLAFERAGGRPITAARPKRVLFNSQFSWDYGWVDYALATALHLRGHDVTIVGCGGLEDYCEQQTCSQDRPSCDTCRGRIDRRAEAFGLPRIWMSDFMTRRDGEEARRIARSRPVKELRECRVSGIDVGRMAFHNLFQYFRMYPHDIVGEVEHVFRRCVASAIQIVRAIGRIFDAEEPDIVVTPNGKFLQWAPFVELAQQRGIRFITWEDYHVRPAGIAMAVNAIAHDMRVDHVWEDESQKALTSEQRKEVHSYFRLWAGGAFLRWRFYDEQTIHGADGLRRELSLRTSSKIVALLPDLTWDSTSVGYDIAFENMYDWIFRVIEYASRRADMDFVIRAHPGEVRLPGHFHVGMSLSEVIERYGPLIPKNVKVLPGDHRVSSYAISEAADVVMVHTSTLGLELPLRGIRTWVAGDTYFRGKGFTVDLTSAQHMTDLLDANAFDNRLTPSEIELAERLAYLARFRQVFSFPYLDDKGGFYPPDFAAFAPGGDDIIDDLCDRILWGDSFLDIGSAPITNGIDKSLPVLPGSR